MIILDESGGTLGWWPVDLSEDVQFAYTLYWEDPTIIVNLTINEVQPFTIYPNPASSICTLKFNSDNFLWNDIILVDISGQFVKSIATSDNYLLQNNVSFNVEGLAQGMYYVVISGNEKTHVEKLIISQ